MCAIGTTYEREAAQRGERGGEKEGGIKKKEGGGGGEKKRNKRPLLFRIAIEGGPFERRRQIFKRKPPR